MTRARPSRRAAVVAGGGTAPDIYQVLGGLVADAHRIVAERGEAIRRDGGTERGSSAADVHEARAAVRRLRAVLGSATDVLDDQWVRSVRIELRWLGGVLGTVRDLDVLTAILSERAGGLGPADAPSAWALVALAGSRRREADEQLSRTLGGDRYRRLLAGLAAAARALSLGASWLQGAGSDQRRRYAPDTSAVALDAAAHLQVMMQRSLDRLDRAADRLEAVPADDDLHRIRKRAKAVRYVAEAGEPLVGRRSRRLARAARRLQDVLGEVRDAASAETWLRRTVGSADGAMGALAAGRLIEQTRRRARRGRAVWPSAYDRVRARGPKAMRAGAPGVSSRG